MFNVSLPEWGGLGCPVANIIQPEYDMIYNIIQYDQYDSAWKFEKFYYCFGLSDKPLKLKVVLQMKLSIASSFY